MIKDIFLLDPQIVFLNHGSFGACPRPVFEAYQAWQRRLEMEPVQFLSVELDDYLHSARLELSKYLHTSENDLVFIPNATYGVNIVAQSINLNPGDEILTTDHEYGACVFCWDHVSKRSGSILKQQSISIPVTSEEKIIDELWLGVTNKTKLIFLSHITSPTSLVMPVEQICKRAHQAGILTLVDGAHAPGQLPVDLNLLGADFYIGNCHKWMLSPKGAGFVYAHPEVQKLIQPLIVSWGYQSKTNIPRESVYIDILQWTGTKDPAAALSVPDAIKFMTDYSWDDIRTSSHLILQNAMGEICEMTGTTPLYPLDSTFFQQMGTIPIPKVKDLNELIKRLFKEYKIEIPGIEWRGQHFLRMSIQGYNTAEDVYQLMNALKILLPEVTA